MITNAKDTTLFHTTTLPQVGEGIGMFLQQMEIGIVQSSQVDGVTKDITTFLSWQACIQPMAEKLAIMKEGERSWRWHTIYAQTGICLDTDDVVLIDHKSYRVMDKTDWREYGYVEFSVIEYYKRFEG